MTVLEISMLVLALALGFALAHVALHLSISTKIDAAINRVTALLHVYHASVVDKIAAIPVPVPVVAADVPTVSWSAQPVAAPKPPTVEVIAATSRDPILLAGALNIGGPPVPCV